MNRSCFPSRGRSKSAAKAGLKLNELIVEITVEIAIVNANCRKNWPTMPEMNAHGMNTADSTRPTAMIGPDLVHGTDRGVARLESMLDVILDGLDNDDRIVDDDTDRQYESEQCQVIEAEADNRHRREGADDRHWHGDQRNDRRRHPCKKTSTTSATKNTESRSALNTSLTDSRI